MRARTVFVCTAAVLGLLLAPAGPASARTKATPPGAVTTPIPQAGPGPGLRPLPSPLYGVTVDDVSNLSAITASARALSPMPTTRIYFDLRRPASYYAPAVSALHPVSYLMGELLDSSDSRRIGVAKYHKRVKSYLSVLGNAVDVWEIGNEVNGNWTGKYPKVEAKLTGAYTDVASLGKRTALTLYYNAGCGDGPRELDPIAFSHQYVPTAVRNGLDYVLLSYYEDACNGIRPSAATWTAYFAQLHNLYPHALLGFGEIGMTNPVTSSTLGAARSLLGYYYGLSVNLPYYAGGYFWWYYDEDCLPHTSKPLWETLQAGFASESAALGP